MMHPAVETPPVNTPPHCESVNRLMVDLKAIRSNIQAIRNHLPKECRIMGMVKASAYGTSPIPLAKFYHTEGIDLVGVAHVDEAIALRSGGVLQDIFVIHTTAFDVAKLVAGGFEVGVSDPDLCSKISQLATQTRKTIKVHLHVNTGMSRLGVRSDQALSLALHIATLPNIELEGVMTHFAAAEDSNQDPFTLSQIALFERVILALKTQGLSPRWIHAANSPGTLRFSIPFCNMVRLGAAPLGLITSDETSQRLPLQEALTLKSRISAITLCKKGESVSYGRTYTVKREEEKIGVIPLGYFDGLKRCYSNNGYVYIGRHKAPMVGTICMDFMMVNLSDCKQVQVGDSVTLFGNEVSANTFARWGQTHINELVTCLGPRIQRIFIDEP